MAALVERRLRLTVLHREGTTPALPSGVEGHAIRARSGAWGTLGYEQFQQPRAAARLGCELLFVPEGGAPIAARMPIAALPADRPPRAGRGPLATLRRAAGQAGRGVAGLTLYPGDVPSYAEARRRARPYPPFVSPGFRGAEPDRTSEYVLCHGVRRNEVALALAAWTWVEGSLGDAYPLLFLGLDPELEQFIRIAAAGLDVSDSIAFHAEVDLDSLPGLYRRAAAYLGVGLHAWGQPLRWSLAAGVPVAAEHSAAAASILGEAGYLAPRGDARALGAACLSLLVEEELADRLRERGRRIAQAYAGQNPLRALREIVTAE